MIFQYIDRKIYIVVLSEACLVPYYLATVGTLMLSIFETFDAACDWTAKPKTGNGHHSKHDIDSTAVL